MELDGDAGLLTDSGLAFLGDIGIDVAPLEARRTKRSGRVLIRPCLDWSERRPHLAGMVGAAICSHGLEEGWARRMEGTREVAVTRKGERVFGRSLGRAG